MFEVIRAVNVNWVFGVLLAGVAGGTLGATTGAEDDPHAASAEAAGPLAYVSEYALRGHEPARAPVDPPAAREEDERAFAAGASAPLRAEKARSAVPLDLGVRLQPPAHALHERGDATSPEAADMRLAQFQLPPAEPGGAAPVLRAPPRLTYQYSFASESLIEYRQDRDLTKRLKDNSLIVVPEVSGFLVYRPTDWLDATLEGVLGKEFAVREEPFVTLPSGETRFPPKRQWSAVIDQAFIRLHTITAPFEFAIGRRNYEDERHWLWDTSMDVASVAARWGRFRVEAFAGRETWVDLDIAPKSQQVRDRNDTYVVYAEYRAENARLAAYTIARHDKAGLEGNPRHLGVRAIGSPTDRFNYWLELAYLGGKDENRKRFEAYGFDVGGTYRWTGVPHLPSVTFGYAYGSGDGNPNDTMNREFRQSGLHANETRFAGISQFMIYGETLDPELSNLKIFTMAFGFRPAPLISVDLVYHRYRLNRIADTFRSSALTAEINQIDTRMSKDMGQAVDIVIGLRRLFGLRRLGLDLRTGLFFPGEAFLQNDGTDARPIIHHARRGFSVVSKIWW